MSVVVVMQFGAGNALHGIEISMFWFYKTLFYTHIQRYTAAAGTKGYKTMQTVFFQKAVMSRITKMQNW